MRRPSSKQPRQVHYVTAREGRYQGMVAMVCGTDTPNAKTTTIPADVTCKRCLRVMEAIRGKGNSL